MKRLFLITGFVVFMVGLANATISRVQSKSANTGATTATTLTITLGSNATVGNTIILGICSGGNSIPFSSIVYGSNSSIPIAESLQGSGATATRTWIGYIPVQEASNTIVITTATAISMCAIAVEYSGHLIVTDIPPLIASNAGSTSNATGTLSATNFANELIVAVMGTRLAETSEATAWLTSPTNSFSSVVQTSTSVNSSSTDRLVAFLERIVSSTGTYSTAGTQTSAAWSNVIASFTDNPTPTPTSTATSTNTPTPTATATSSFTPCAATPTATATFTPTNTPTPTSTPTATSTPIPKAFTFGQ